MFEMYEEITVEIKNLKDIQKMFFFEEFRKVLLPLPRQRQKGKDSAFALFSSKTCYNIIFDYDS